MNTDLMVVRIRFGRGPVITRRAGKNSRIANLSASFLTLISISCAALGIWRIGADLGWAGDFAIQQGFFSHEQVWLGAAAVIQYSAWQLKRYAKSSLAADTEGVPLSEEPSGSAQTAASV